MIPDLMVAINEENADKIFQLIERKIEEGIEPGNVYFSVIALLCLDNETNFNVSLVKYLINFNNDYRLERFWEALVCNVIANRRYDNLLTLAKAIPKQLMKRMKFDYVDHNCRSILLYYS